MLPSCKCKAAAAVLAVVAFGGWAVWLGGLSSLHSACNSDGIARKRKAAVQGVM